MTPALPVPSASGATWRGGASPTRAGAQADTDEEKTGAAAAENDDKSDSEAPLGGHGERSCRRGAGIVRSGVRPRPHSTTELWRSTHAQIDRSPRRDEFAKVARRRIGVRHPLGKGQPQGCGGHARARASDCAEDSDPTAPGPRIVDSGGCLAHVLHRDILKAACARAAVGRGHAEHLPANGILPAPSPPMLNDCGHARTAADAPHFGCGHGRSTLAGHLWLLGS